MATMQGSGVLRQIDRIFGAGSVAGLGDGQLLERFLDRRDESAFAALVQRHGPMVLATCRAILRDSHAAEDASQATFLVLARRAGTIRGGEALGGWLHRVAVRVAARAGRDAARRRAEERRAAASRAGGDADADAAAGGDLRAALHAEIDRLPERYRLPIVLCHLEGLSRAEAAARLRWSEGAVRGRLARGRRLLGARLSRRGIASTGTLLAAGLAREASAALPEAWVAATARAATGQAGVGAGVAAVLAGRVLRSLLAARLKGIAAWVLLLGGVAVAATVVLDQRANRGDDRERGATAPASAPVPPPAARKIAAQAAGREEDEPGRMVEVRGRVVDPDGKPVTGAILRTAFLETDDHRTQEVTSGPDGRFLMRIPRSIRNAAMLNDDGGDTFPWVVASAPGFGPGWARGALEAAAAGELTVRLVEDGPPIEGRIVDLEGRPVADARVKVENIWFAHDDRPPYRETGDLSSWIEAVNDRGVRGPSDGLGQLPTTITTTTGPDGRFRLTGIGRGRVAEMFVSGPTIATTSLYAMTRNGPEARCTDHRLDEARVLVFHAPRFEHAAAPTKPIEGVLRDKDTGRPIEGMTLHAAVFDARSLVPARGIEATTDAQGRYRITGLPKAPAYRLFVEQGEHLPYPRATFRAPADSPGLEPVGFDMAIKRGVWLRGRVTDEATGEPVPGYVNPFTFHDNPSIGEFPGYVTNGLTTDYLDDGRYEVVALPGRNLIACRSELNRYRGSIGAEAIQGINPKFMSFPTLPLNCYIRNYHVLAEVDIDPGAESATLDLQVDPGRSLTLAVVDPEGKPIGGTNVSGIGDMFPSIVYPRVSATIEIHALDPSKPRRVTVTHAGRKLIGSIYLEGDESGQQTVRLQPWGTLTGRIVDDEGKPRGGLALSSAGGSFPTRPDVQGILPGGDYRDGIRVGSDGRFRVEGLVPGLKYGAMASERSRGIGDLFQDVTVAPGEVKDLGDLKVVPRQEYQP